MPRKMDENHDVLFAFDDYSIEGTRGVKVDMANPDKYEANPVVARGCQGDPDELECCYHSVVYDEGTWRMWYCAQSSWSVHGRMIAYAESDDGINWRKPKLGLVEHAGSDQNNLVRTIRGLADVAVLCDPEAPPEHRYIMAGSDMSWYKSWSPDGPAIARIDVSPDGYNWSPIKDEPGIISQVTETGAIYKFRGQYHIGGQQSWPIMRLPLQEDMPVLLAPRTFVIWRSPRLDRWPLERTKAFFKPMRSSSPYRRGWDGEQVHMGASVKTYRNVCVGICGQWHHPPIYDEEGGLVYDGSLVSIDLGLVLSNDGLRYREPAPGFTFIKRDQELTWDRDLKNNRYEANILLLQGSIVNTEKLTHIYYAASAPRGNAGLQKGARGGTNIGLATLRRDRFGCLSLLDEHHPGQLVTRPLSYNDQTKLYVNADVPAGSSLQVCLLDEHGLDALPGYGQEDGGRVTESGLNVEVIWKDKPFLPTGQPFKVRCTITGQTRVFVLYLT